MHDAQLWNNAGWIVFCTSLVLVMQTALLCAWSGRRGRPVHKSRAARGALAGFCAATTVFWALGAPLVLARPALAPLVPWQQLAFLGFLGLCSAAWAFGLGLAVAAALERLLDVEREGSGGRSLDGRSPSHPLLDASLDAGILIDAGGVVREWGRKAGVLFGWTAEEARGSRLADRILPPEERAPFQRTLGEVLEAARRGADGARWEGSALRRDGGWTPVEISLSALGRTPDPAALVVVRDISAAKEVEEELIRARDAAIAATSAKSEFLATMSHEIRTPMNGVLGMTELLLQTELDEHQRHLADVAYGSAESLLDIINDILDFSKIESGKVELDDEVYDLHEAVGRAVALLAGSAHARGLELCCDIGPSVPRRQRGDPSRLRQVLTNLVSNGIKFTHLGEVVVRVGLDSEAEPRFLRFEVSDTGIGMDRTTRSRIFDPFQQADGSTTRDYGGTGLGLAICKRLVERMGGRIEVESEPKRGSTFTFTLPLAGEAGATDEAASPTPLSGQRILVVDDSETSRAILARQTTAWGLTSLVAAGAEEALAILERGSEGEPAVDLAVFDLDMPDVGGLELLEQTTTRALLPPSRVLVLSSIGMDSAVSAARKLGCGGHRVKPALQSELRRELERLVANGGQDAPRATAVPSLTPVLRSPDLPARVLLVEDNPVNREVALAMLALHGCEVDVVGNGFEAVAAVETSTDRPYDVVLMDCEMPRMDGFEATEEIRERERTHALPRLPVVAMTANVLEDSREACRQAGMDDYLGKPLTAPALREVLERVLAGGRTAPARSALEAAPPAGTRVAPSGQPAAGSASDPPLDLRALEQLREMQMPGRSDLATRAIDLYLGSAPGLLETLRQAIAEDDASAARRAAHSLKSSSANLGATRLAAACREIERLAAEGSTKDAEPLLEEVLEHYETARAALARERRA